MLIKLIFQFVFVVILAGMMHSCHGSMNSPYPPPGGIYFAFPDKDKTATLQAGSLLIQQTDWNDSTKIINSMKVLPSVGDMFSNRDYGSMFHLPRGGDSLTVIGWNKLRIVYPGKSEPDWLIFYTKYKGWPQPEQVKFNGKPISRLEVDQPTPPSYLYLLK